MLLSRAAEGRRIELELIESCWSNWRPRLSGESGLKKLLGGLSLLGFWLLSPRVWAQSLRRNYMILWALGTVLLLVAWYCGAIVALLTVWSSELLDQVGLAAFAPTLKTWGEKLGGWKVWVGVSLVTAFLPMLRVVDIAHASMAYLRNQEGSPTRSKRGSRKSCM